LDLQLTHRHVLITGGSKGIGLACAEAFLAEGARVTLVARNADTLRAAAEATRAGADRLRWHAADLRDADAAAGMLDAVESTETGLGPVDILVSSAGAAQRTAAPDLTPAAWHAAMDAKFFSYIHVLDPMVKRMAARGAGTIVNIVGTGGKLPTTTHLAGGAANAALMLASTGLAHAYAAQGLRINVINPGPVLTGRLEQAHALETRLAEAAGRPAPPSPGSDMPQGRVATPQEVADLAVFLASPRSGYTNGAVVTVDGASKPVI